MRVSATQKMRILIADNTKVLGDLAREMLAEHEYIYTFSPKDAVLLYKEHAPDRVFLYIVCPERDGFDVLKEIRCYDANAYIVMLTSSNLEHDRQDAQMLGADGYLLKPFRQEDLSGAIERCFVRRR